MKHVLPVYLLLLFILFSCTPDEENLPEPDVFQENQFLSFKLLRKNNPQLPSDVEATLIGNEIHIQLPGAIKTDSLIASFETRHSGKVFVGNKEQISGVSVNAFEGQVNYKVMSPDKTTSHHNVEIQQSFPELDQKLKSLMQQYQIPGLSIAITKNEKLVFAKSYGFANKERRQPVHNESLFRIASISKPVTVIAILKLVQGHKISLQDRVFGRGSILGTDYGQPPVGSNIGLITVQNLLDHKSGWTNDPSDPLLSEVSLTQKQIITQAVLNRPLIHRPGSTYNYNNLGYCILGRIIEKVTALPYQDYVKQEILFPCGVKRMTIAGNSAAERFPDEVAYYQKEWNPYSLNINRMDANGGWVASATDLMRFMVSADRNSNKKDLIDASLLDKTYFGSSNWFHSGSLPGSSTFIVRLNDDYNFVLLANSRVNSDATMFFKAFYYPVKETILAKTDWSAADLFESSL